MDEFLYHYFLFHVVTYRIYREGKFESSGHYADSGKADDFNLVGFPSPGFNGTGNVTVLLAVKHLIGGIDSQQYGTMMPPVPPQQLETTVEQSVTAPCDLIHRHMSKIKEKPVTTMESLPAHLFQTTVNQRTPNKKQKEQSCP
jgi:hypothetical protein